MKRILYTVLAVVFLVIIYMELIRPAQVPAENFIRVLVMIGALSLIAYLAAVSPQKLNLALKVKKSTAQPLFKITMPSERTSQMFKRPGQASDPEPGHLFRIIPPNKPPCEGAHLNAEPVGRAAPKKMFGTAGIRGRTNIEITPLLVMKMAQAWGEYLGNKGRVAVGYDSRYGAEMLAFSVAGGLMSRGISVVDCGIIPTGGLAAYIVKSQLSGGVLITGSHTPYNMTGLIILKSDGSYLDNDLARELEKRFANNDQAKLNEVPLESLGKYEKSGDALQIYQSFLLKQVDNELIRSRHYRVLVDPANGPAALVFPALLNELGCAVVPFNAELNPVPNRPSEPRRGNLGETAAKVREHNCALGAATDVDADRVLFIDAGGNILSEDLVGALFAREVLTSDGGGEPPRTGICVTPINSSALIAEVAQACQAKLHYCCIGQPATLTKVRELKADFSYEESGKYYFCRDVLWPDGILATLKLLEIMARHNKPLAELVAGFTPFHQVKHTIRCAPHLVDKVFNRIQKLWQEQATENRLEDITIDGLKRTYNDKSWLLIRKSGTEPLIRVYADAPTLVRAEELVRIGEDIVNQAMPVNPDYSRGSVNNAR